ncbi:MAG: very short patch repair endonuclease [Planctomycetes bacterium]|nr:very short patch repair endonuclease [Planctomycetota bacterium]
MADTMDRVTRSRVMGAICSSNTTPEIMVRRLLYKAGFRFRLHAKNLPGSPDIVLPKYGAVVFVHGCFWHGHDCPSFRLPKTRKMFWQNKIEKNQARDGLAATTLRRDGWRVAVVWECALRGRGRIRPERMEKRLSAWVRGAKKRLEISGRAKP